MKHSSKKSVFPVLAAGLGLAGVIVLIAVMAATAGLSNGLVQGDLAIGYPGEAALVYASALVTPTVTPTPAAMLYMPWMSVFKTPEVEMLNAWTSQTLSGKLQAFLQGVPMYYQTSGVNNLPQPARIGLTWEQSGPCDSGQIFSSTLSIPSGPWSHNILDFSPNCTGVFTATASISYTATKTSLAPRFVVNEPGSVKINVQQGFDKCSHPDIDDMQAWWDESPYVVFNLYLGGISYACKNNPLDAVYVRELAEQGWWFIPTWVGPQAPCSKYTHKMSADRDEAYQQGRDEADEALDTAESLGLFGQKIIYYDLEAYSGDDKCRNTVKAFIRGWTERLHELDHKAGGYGASCRSYIEDWAENTPPPDDIWIAHWIADEYDPSATVWDAVCLDPTTGPPLYWLNHQRLRQYAGGHTETWGKVPLTIDSNVLDGEVIDMAVASSSSQATPNSVVVETFGLELREMGLIDSQRGWLLGGAENLLWTEEGGNNWRRVTPAIFAGGRILGVRFRDAADGWAIGVMEGGGELLAAHTTDGGESWAANPLPLSLDEVLEVVDASLDVLQDRQVYVSLELQSGSSFSLGRLFTSQDGGVSWEEREIPLGEPVAFLDGENGWVAGGAAGDQLYRSTDGGYTWQAYELELPEERTIAEVGLPRFDGGMGGWLPVRARVGEETATLIYSTQDGGESWQEDTLRAYSQVLGLEFYQQSKPGAGIFTPGGLPAGTISTAGIPQGMVWAITQEGSCEGNKYGQDGNPVVCTRVWKLLRSRDGGRSWEEMTP